MRRKLIAVMLAVVLAGSADAASLAGFGVKAGINFSTQEYDYNVPIKRDANYRAGLDLGIFREWTGLPFVGLLTELHYVQKGMKEEFLVLTIEDPSGTKEEFSSRVDYLTFCVLPKLDLPFGTAGTSFYLAAGPRLDIKLGHETDYNGPIYDEFRSWDLGADVAAGFSFMRFLVESRFSYNFTDSDKLESLDVKNTTFSILAGVEF